MGRGKKNQKRNRGLTPLGPRSPKRLGRVPMPPAWLLERRLFLLSGGRPTPEPLSAEEQAVEDERRHLQERDRLIYAGHRSSVSRFRREGGRLLFQRLGNLNAGRQDRGMTKGYAPERRGIWAFPWPAGDIGFFAGHKWEEVVPKHLRYSTINALWDEIEELESGEQSKQRRQELEALASERERWIREQGPKALPLHRFWYGGELYARINLQGEFIGGGRDGWQKMTVSQFVEAARKSGIGYGDGHLEVFIPRL